MSEITLQTFEQAVHNCFEPIANGHGWPLTRRAAKVYKSTPYFVMRVRFEVGAHRKSINATLIPDDEMPGDVEKGGSGELGVAVIAGYNGVPIEFIPWDQTEEGLFAEAQHVAGMAKQYGLPYLLGQKSDWEKVKEYIQAKIDKRTEEIKRIKFPSFVQKRWHLPPPPKEGGKD